MCFGNLRHSFNRRHSGRHCYLSISLRWLAGFANRAHPIVESFISILNSATNSGPLNDKTDQISKSYVPSGSGEKDFADKTDRQT